MSSVEHIPEKLRRAVEHLQETFDSSDFKVSWTTQHLCFADLHPANPHRYIGHEDNLAQFRATFVHLKRILGIQTSQIFDQTISAGTESAIFHAYAEIYRAGMESAVRSMFVDAFQIATANTDVIGSDPIGWAAEQVKNRIDNGHNRFITWTKNVCDVQPLTGGIGMTDEAFEEMVWWRSWRAPKFVVMRPSGSNPYRAAEAWNREDQQRTNELLTSLSKRFLDGLGFELDRVKGAAHVLLAKQKRPQNTELRVSEVSGPDELDDHKFSKMAIELARKSVSESGDRPRPFVGAVVVKDGRVLGTGFRGESAAGNHAEYVAMEVKLKDEILAGATVYTTLEPCTTRNHPKIPCAERLIERKVKRVVIGMLDPDNRIRGLGQMRLRTAKITTQFFPPDLMNEAEELNRNFTRFSTQHAEQSSASHPDSNKFKGLTGQRVKLRPIARRADRNGPLPEIDEDWLVLRVDDDGLLLRNERGTHMPPIAYDQIENYISDPSRNNAGIVHGFLTLKVQLTLTGNDVLVEPR